MVNVLQVEVDVNLKLTYATNDDVCCQIAHGPDVLNGQVDDVMGACHVQRWTRNLQLSRSSRSHRCAGSVGGTLGPFDGVNKALRQEKAVS